MDAKKFAFMAAAAFAGVVFAGLAFNYFGDLPGLKDAKRGLN